MKSSRNLPALQMKVGTLVTVGLSIAILGMIFPTKGINPFSPTIRLETRFSNVGGLRPSSPVWFSGVEVGSVKEVDFVRGSNPPRLRVVMTIERKIMPYIKKDSTAHIRSIGLLGDTYVDLVQGTEEAHSVRPGDTIPGEDPKDFSEDLQAMMASGKSLLASLEQISRDISEGKGSLGQLAQDPSLYSELRDAVRELKSFARALNQEDGTAKKLVQDPALYDELVAAVQDIRELVSDLKQTEQKLISPETKEKIDQTVETASRVVKRVGEYQEKMDKIRFDLNFGLYKHLDNVASGHVHLGIWPNDDRYYVLGIQKITDLYGNETEQTTFDVQLAWRILQTPLFIRGGLIRDEYFVAGLDARFFDDDFLVLLDAYRVEYDPVQMDLRVGVVLLDLLELTAGVEDVWGTPFYKAGLTIHYRDDDLLTIIMKGLY
ncbi:MCE family protein [candidate division FCPU426 bacterium]|nr:MCE family protein [candidate division FCPU426 bacterium]